MTMKMNRQSGSSSSYTGSQRLYKMNALWVVVILLSTTVSTVIPSTHGFVIPSKNKQTTSSISSTTQQQVYQENSYFTLVEHPSERGATVLEAPVQQDGVRMFIGLDNTSSSSSADQEEDWSTSSTTSSSTTTTNGHRPGNGGIRLFHYPSTHEAVDDAVRLAKGMTRKHDMFRTGFSGAKVVVKSDHVDLDTVQRQDLMQDAAAALHALQGSMYTGCDLNTNDVDMDYLVQATGGKYVLAGRNSRVDTNVATASSVIGSILGTLQAMENSENNENDNDKIEMSHLTFTVQGCGKVGRTVAEELVRLGAGRVQTCDLHVEAAEIPGCHALAPGAWATTPTDFLVPCANSLALTPDICTHFPPGLKYCVGAANSPFSNAEAKAIFEQDRNVMHIPESISSAGAILADSVEWYDLNLYQTVEPTLMYGWIRDISKAKASTLILESNKDPSTVESNLKRVVPTRSGDPVGKEFPDWIRANTEQTDVLIVGGGVAGTATAFSLSQKNQKSILVEQGSSIAPATSSSNGDSRMYRKMYSNAFFSQMQAKALERWNDVEEISGEKLLQQNGLLFYGEDTGETVEGSVLGAKQVMEELNLPHTFYATGDEIAAAYPSLAGCKGKPYSGVVEETAGHIRASKACQAMVKAAGDSCQMKLDTKIVGMQVQREDGKVVAVTRDGKTIVANNAVLAAGPWTNAVLESAGLPKLKLDVWQVQWAHYEVDPAVAHSIPQAFHFRKESSIDGGLYYVFPASASESVNSNGKTYVKVGVDFPTGESLDGMDSFCYKGADNVLELMDEWVQEHLPQAGNRVDSYCHPYTMTSDSYFIMDKMSPNVSVFSGGSGRAFKFGPLLGDCLVSLLTNEPAPVDMQPFSAKREQVKA